MKILIYGGTTEGRQLAEILHRNGLNPVVSVATEYGEEVMENADPDIEVRMGRLNVEEMHVLAVSGDFIAVVDATHPFAVEVSRNIRESLQGTGIPLLRLSRDTNISDSRNASGRISSDISDCNPADVLVSAADTKREFLSGAHLHMEENTAVCAAALRKTQGNILLTTGSKELSVFCQYEQLWNRIFARVLPGEESIRLCREAGLSGRQIIAMQGPFSKEMNLAMIHQYNIGILVTKESGHTGGADTKIAAAAEAGIPCYVIRRPSEQNGENSYRLPEVLEQLSEIAGVPLHGIEESDPGIYHADNNLNHAAKYAPTGADLSAVRDKKEGPGSPSSLQVILAGIGMGTEATETHEVHEAIAHADYVFGAERVIRNVDAPKCKARYALYQPSKVIPMLSRIAESDPMAHIVILFSGDSGFYSGAAGMRKALQEAAENDPVLKAAAMQVRTLPGISSLSYLSAAAGIPWQDAAIISLHGVPEEIWKRNLQTAMAHSQKIFFLTSGAADVRKLGEYLTSDRMHNPEAARRSVKNSIHAESGNSLSMEADHINQDIRLVLGYQLSYPDERIITCTPEDCLQIQQEGLYAGFLLLNKADTEIEGVHKGQFLTPGIRDDQFIRGKVPMTKEEIRMLVLCKLRLQTGSIVYDIGSGIGSIAVEAALIPGMGEVYAIEQNPEGVELIRKNADQFGADKVHVIQGMAPDVFRGRKNGIEQNLCATHASEGCGKKLNVNAGTVPEGKLPIPTHAFIGGTKGNLREILQALQGMNPHMRIVMTAVTLETIRDMQDAMEEFQITDEDVVAVSVSRAEKMGHYHLMKAANTVYIFSFSFTNNLQTE